MVLAVIFVTVSVTAFAMNKYYEARDERAARIKRFDNAIEKLETELVEFRGERAEFRLEMKNELGDIKREIVEMKMILKQ